MKLEQLLQSLLLTSSFVILATIPANSEEIPTQQVQRHSRSTGAGMSYSTSVQLVKLNTEIPRLSEIKPPLISTDKLVQSPRPDEAGFQKVIEVTGVKINPIDKKLEIILETPRGEKLQITQKEQGNTYIADIPSSQLRLLSGNTFRQEKPIAGITEVTVTNFDADSIRVTVIGETGVPAVELFDSDEGLIFSLTPLASFAQTTQTPEVPKQAAQTSQTPEVQPIPQPERQTQLSEPS